jgi:hypothetical protein
MKPEDYIKIGIIAASFGAVIDTKIVFVNRGNRVRSVYRMGKRETIACDETELECWRDSEIEFWIGYSEACNELYVRLVNND